MNQYDFYTSAAGSFGGSPSYKRRLFEEAVAEFKSVLLKPFFPIV